MKGKLILIDKDINWTSFDVVSKIRSFFKKKFNLKKLKVGHAGTLDPLATGLLIICYGKMTKEINSFIGLDKSYSGKMIIGSSTPSYDLETKPNVFYQTNHINEKLIYEKAEDFIGEIMQKPPIFSAVKKNGVRSYKLARKGEQVNLEKRKIIVRDFKITEINFPELSFEVDCSKGTYIRSLINDFGKALKSGAHLTELRRTKIGEFSVNDSLKIMDFIKTFKS